MIAKLLKRFKRVQEVTEEPKYNTVVPDGWFVMEAGQSLLHMLWYVDLANFGDIVNNKKDVTIVSVEEFDSYEQALDAAIRKIK